MWSKWIVLNTREQQLKYLFKWSQAWDTKEHILRCTEAENVIIHYTEGKAKQYLNKQQEEKTKQKEENEPKSSVRRWGQTTFILILLL